jgi:hypothetical protein
MPCTMNGGPFGHILDQNDNLKEYTDNLTRLLCEACNKLDMRKASPELRGWWQQHKKSKGHVK